MQFEKQVTDHYRLSRRHFLSALVADFAPWHCKQCSPVWRSLPRGRSHSFTAPCPASESRNLSVHGGRSVAARSVRAEAAFGPEPRPTRRCNQFAARHRHWDRKFLTLGPAAEMVPRGESGAMISNLMPHLAGVADELCFLHGMQVDNPAHDLATLQFTTGVVNEVRPSMAPG